MTASRRPLLRALADDVGVVAGFRAIDGTWRASSDETCVALLGAMGLDASREALAGEILAERIRNRAGSLIDPVRVVRRNARGIRLAVHPAERGGARSRWEATIRTEAGRVLSAGGVARGRSVLLPAIAECGFHEVHFAWQAGSERREARQTLVVVPPRCVDVGAKVNDGRAFGICANLYSLRDGRAEIGDLTTLASLCRWAGRFGAAFVGVNPLNAIRAGGDEISPYSPISRVFRSALYLDIEEIPEWRQCAAAQQVNSAIAAGTERIEYGKIRREKREILMRLYDVFCDWHRDRGTVRGEAYARFVRDGGEELRGFALFSALEAHFGTADGGTRGWRDWPVEYQDPEGPCVRLFADGHRRDIGFHQWVQFEIDRQLGGCARVARRAGLGLGLYQDLPIGALPSGCEEWLHRDLFCHGASVGAPPDAFFAAGQDWGLAPISPIGSRAAHLAYWARLLRAAFGHAGALRVDHVMGLTRQYWIPKGASPREGAYVRMPAEQLFGVLALESERAGAVVIGEDLGTVPDEIPPLLRRWGVLSSKVLYFEQQQDGRFRAPAAYPRRCFVSANTHDLATLPGFEAGRDLDLHAAAGVLADPEAVTRMRGERARAVAMLRRQTRARSNEALVRPVYAHLARSRAALVGVALDDLGGEVEPVNLPGVRLDRYPSWQRRMGKTLDAIAADPVAIATLADLRRARPRTR